MTDLMTEKKEVISEIRKSTSLSNQEEVIENIQSNAILQDKKPFTWWEKEIYGEPSIINRQKIIMETWNDKIFSSDLTQLFGETIIDSLYASPSRYITELRDTASKWDLRNQILHLGDRYSYDPDDNQFYIHTYKKNVQDLDLGSNSGNSVHVPVAHTKEFKELCDQVRSASFSIYKQEQLQHLRGDASLSDDEIEEIAVDDAHYYAEGDVQAFGYLASCNFFFIVTEDGLNIFYSSSSNNNDGIYPRKLRKVDNPLLMVRTGRYSIFRHPSKDVVPFNKDTLSSYCNPIKLSKRLGELLKDKNEILYNFNEFEYLF